MTRRTALTIVASLLTRTQAQAQSSTCRLPENLTLDFGAGACAVKTITVKQGALSAKIPVSEVLTALGAKVGDD